MKKNKNGFSIVFAMGMALISTLMVIYMLEYMIPFSRNVKGIENSTAAYYNAMSAVENALFFITQSAIGAESTSINTGYSYQINATGSVLPAPGYGNSAFDSNWSRLATGEPVQISLPTGILWANTKIFFRVPNFDNNAGTSDAIDSSLSGDVINWQLSSTGNTLNSQTGQRFPYSNICSSTDGTTFCISTGNNISGKSGLELNNTSMTVSSFYAANCLVDHRCTLKLSIINSLKGQTNGVGGKIIPYIEYKIDFGATKVPSNVIRINVKGNSYGFYKEFDIYSPRESLIEAYDFTVFQ